MEREGWGGVGGERPVSVRRVHQLWKCVCVCGGGWGEVPCSKSNEGNEGLDGCRCWGGGVNGLGLTLKEGLEGRMSR